MYCILHENPYKVFVRCVALVTFWIFFSSIPSAYAQNQYLAPSTTVDVTQDPSAPVRALQGLVGFPASGSQVPKVMNLAGRLFREAARLYEADSLSEAGLEQARTALRRISLNGRAPTAIDVPGDGMVDMHDPLLVRPPDKAEEQSFDAKFQVHRYGPETKFVPVLGIPAGTLSKDAVRRAIAISERIARDMLQALGEGRLRIQAPYENGNLQTSLESMTGPGLTYSPSPHALFRALSRDEKVFFRGFLKDHLASDIFGILMNYLQSDEPDKEAAIFTKNDMDRLMNAAQFLRAVIFHYKAADLNSQKIFFDTYSFFLNMSNKEGTLIDASITGNVISYLQELQIPSGWLGTDEGRGLANTLIAINPDLHLQSFAGERYPRDLRSYLTSSLDLAVLTTGTTQDLHIGVGGAVIPGYAVGEFILVSNRIPENERRVLAWKMNQLEGGRSIRLYSLPPGFVTIVLDGRRYWLSTSHIDSVINVIDGMFTNDERARVLIDPYYFEMVQRNNEFNRFIHEQGIKTEDIVLIDKEDTDLNLANFTTSVTPQGERKLVFNAGSTTVQKLGLRDGVYVEVPVPVRNLAYLRAGKRCVTSLTPRHELQIPVQTELEIDPELLDEAHFWPAFMALRPNVVASLAALTDYWVRKVELKAGSTEIDFTHRPGYIVIRIPTDGDLNDAKQAILDVFRRTQKLLADYWDGRIIPRQPSGDGVGASEKKPVVDNLGIHPKSEIHYLRSSSRESSFDLSRFRFDINHAQQLEGLMLDWLENSQDHDLIDIVLHDLSAAQAFAPLLEALVQRRPGLVPQGLGSPEHRLHLILVVDGGEEAVLPSIYNVLNVTKLDKTEMTRFDIETIRNKVKTKLLGNTDVRRVRFNIDGFVGTLEARRLYESYGEDFTGVHVELLDTIRKIDLSKGITYKTVSAFFLMYVSDQELDLAA